MHSNYPFPAHANSPALDILQNTYGFAAFRGNQERIIDTAIAGRDSLVLMPTGGGKSLCYQIPAQVRAGMGLVISPLIALMQDQVSALQQSGIAAAFLNSTLSGKERSAVTARMYAGELDLLYIAPERLMLADTLAWLGRFPLSLIAIDEAHCVSQWGHDFRQDYLLLNRLADAFPGVPRMALTATATVQTRADIIDNLALNRPEVFVSSFDRPNIRYSVAPRQDAKKQLLRFLAAYQEDSGIVYCLSRKKVEATAAWLCARGFTALPYHAGLEAGVRAEHQARFLREDGVIMVATVAFGMGIDKPDVRFVAHLDLPGSMEAYYQETGRAGRDNEPAEAWMVYGLNDVVQRSQMLDRSSAAEQHKRNERAKLDALLGWCEATDCRRQSLLAYFGEDMADGQEGEEGGRANGAACGNCDTCLAAPRTWDATEAAQKLLSCVYRTGQRFGAGHVLDVLLGVENERMFRLGHNKLSTFGIGGELALKQWRSVLRQLIVRGFLYADAERYGALKLKQTARALLRGELQLRLREDVAEARPAKAKKDRHGAATATTDAGLMEALRACRRTLADEQGIAPYMVFHDTTLRQMAAEQPANDQALLDITGVGEFKLKKYGAAFLEVIRGHKSAVDRSE